MDDRRIAEWLSVDHPLGEGDEAEFEASGEDQEEAAERPRSRPIPQGRSAIVGFEGQSAYLVQLIEAVARRIRRRPLAALAVGAGIGFVIGGALSFRTGRLLLAAGARHVVRDLLKQLL
jgi:ElaB/YqjD/DUF883 family membrane-anchored ribosome-binding protein